MNKVQLNDKMINKIGSSCITIDQQHHIKITSLKMPIGYFRRHDENQTKYAGSMKRNPDTEIRRETAGLCADCTNMRRVESHRGSIFIFCELSIEDKRFAKYPRLPVLACDGHHSRTFADNTEG